MLIFQTFTRRLRRHWAVWFWRCVLAIQLSAIADATARRSVAYLITFL
ncbi:MAG: hypothetical protein LBQ66_14830 [Planctomycetaceae bacterium]|nr:hypothetical protein [Planctomycetaceae bacterium]